MRDATILREWHIPAKRRTERPKQARSANQHRHCRKSPRRSQANCNSAIGTLLTRSVGSVRRSVDARAASSARSDSEGSGRSYLIEGILVRILLPISRYHFYRVLRVLSARRAKPRRKGIQQYGSFHGRICTCIVSVWTDCDPEPQ